MTNDDRIACARALNDAAERATKSRDFVSRARTDSGLMAVPLLLDAVRELSRAHEQLLSAVGILLENAS